MVQKTNHAEKPHPSRLLLTLDLMGTFVFALEGALAAVDGDLDLLGLMVLSFCTALGGGIIRDSADWRHPSRFDSRLAFGLGCLPRGQHRLPVPSFRPANSGPIDS